MNKKKYSSSDDEDEKEVNKKENIFLEVSPIEEVKKKWSYEDEKEKIFFQEVPVMPKKLFYSNANDQKKINDILLAFNKPNYRKFYESFKGKKPNFFNSSNIIAFLLSSGFFLVSFFLPYFVFYFLFVFLYVLFFVDQEAIKEKNKFLFAFHKAWNVVLLLNFQGPLKAIPFLCLFGPLFANVFLFFGKNSKFIPVFYYVNKKAFMKFQQNIDLKEFFETGKMVIPIDENYEQTKFFPVCKKKNKK